jgi:hypothetical protein
MKTLFVSWHGIGDNIVITPVIRKYKEDNPDTSIGLAHLGRLPMEDLFKVCPYINDFFGISDVWNDFDNMNIGRATVLMEAKNYADRNDYDNVIEISLHPSLAIHKLHRAEKEIGVIVEDYRTEIFPLITDKVRKEADKFLEDVVPPYVFVHRESGSDNRTGSPQLMGTFLGHEDKKSLIEYGSHGMVARHLPIGNIPLEMEILSRCSRVYCVDSFIYHAAYTLEIPTVVLFLQSDYRGVIPLFKADLRIIDFFFPTGEKHE